MMNTVRKSENLLPFPVISAAANGDTTAMCAILKHYEGYIAKLCTRTLKDDAGNTYPDCKILAFRTSTFLLSELQNSCCPIQSIILSCISIPPKSSLLHHDKWYSSALPIPCCPAFLISL